MSSKAVMPPDNTAQIFKKGIKEEPAPVTFPHRMGAQNRPRGLLLSCGMQDFTPPGKPAAQRVSSGRRKTLQTADIALDFRPAKQLCRFQPVQSGNQDIDFSKSFVDDTAEKLGVAPSTVRRQIQTAKNLTEEAEDIILP